MHIEDNKVYCIFQKSAAYYVNCNKEPKYFYLFQHPKFKLSIGHFRAYCGNCHIGMATQKEYMVSEEEFLNKLKHLILL